MCISKVLLLTVSFVLVTQAFTDTCSKQTNPTTSFSIVNKKYTWSNAIKACQAEGGNLVSIQTKEKSDDVYKFIVDKGISSPDVYHAIWTSGNKLKDKVNWFWLALEPVVFTNWDVVNGEPNSATQGEDCLSFYNNGSSAVWNDVLCEHYEFYPLCEKPVCRTVDPIPHKEVSEVHCHCHCDSHAEGCPTVQ